MIAQIFGVLPTVGDTIGPGAVMRMVRTAPVVQQIVANLKEVAPTAWVFNYTNPMAMITGRFLECGHERTVGLCHSIQGAYFGIADFLGVPADEVRYTAGGKDLRPMPLAAVMTPHVLCHQMTLQGILQKDRRLLVQAMQADPMTGAVLTLPRIREMAEELFSENAGYMKDWP